MKSRRLKKWVQRSRDELARLVERLERLAPTDRRALNALDSAKEELYRAEDTTPGAYSDLKGRMCGGRVYAHGAIDALGRDGSAIEADIRECCIRLRYHIRACEQQKAAAQRRAASK